MTEKKLGLGKHRTVKTTLAELEKGGANSLITKRLQMNIPEDLHKAFKRECLEQDKEMTDVVIELLRDWLQKNTKPVWMK